jgi:hypothetical protein
MLWFLRDVVGLFADTEFDPSDPLDVPTKGGAVDNPQTDAFFVDAEHASGLKYL